jgi:hypothetical protein
MIHCSACVDAGRVKNIHIPPPPKIPKKPPIVQIPPKPLGTVRPTLFRIGGLGALLSIIGVVLTMQLGFIGFFKIPLYFFAAGLSILAIGCYGIYWNYGCEWGLLGTASLPVLGVLLGLGAYFFQVMAVVVAMSTSLVIVHLSTSHMRKHLPKYGFFYILISLNRIGFFFGGIIIIFFLGEGVLLSSYAFYSALGIFYLLFLWNQILNLIFFFFVLKPDPSIKTSQLPMPRVWKQLLVISILVMIICPTIYQAYYASLYDNKTIVHGDVRGSLELHGKNTIMVNGMYDWDGTDWVVQVDGLVDFSYQRGGISYNEQVHKCTKVTLTPFKNHGGFLIWNLTQLSGNVTFDEMKTYEKGYSMGGFTLMGVSGELNGELEPINSFMTTTVNITYNNQTIVGDNMNWNDLIRFHSNGTIRIKATISNNGTLWVPWGHIVWKPLNGKLKLTDFSGTVVQNGKIFFGDVTIDGKDITIWTIQNPYRNSGVPDDGPSRYWNIDVAFTNGNINGSYYPFWGLGALIGVGAMIILNAIGIISWKKNKKGRDKIETRVSVIRDP